MRPHLFIPIHDWPNHQRVTCKIEETTLTQRTLRLDWELVPKSVDAVMHVFNQCWCETGRKPAMLLLGWRTYLEFSWFVTQENFSPIESWDGVPIICDPSVEKFAKAIEHRELIGCSKGPFLGDV